MVGKTKRLPRHVREQQMMDAAVTMFASRGYSAASMDEIAELAGVSKPMVYLYLNSKEELFAACVRREAEALKAAVAASVEDGLAPDRQLWRGLRAFFAHVAERRDGWTVLARQAHLHGEPVAGEVVRMREELAELVTGLIAAAAAGVRCERPIAEREVSGLAHALVGAAESLADWADAVPDQAPKDTAGTLMNFAWVGLSELMHGRSWPQNP